MARQTRSIGGQIENGLYFFFRWRSGGIWHGATRDAAHIARGSGQLSAPK